MQACPDALIITVCDYVSKLVALACLLQKHRLAGIITKHTQIIRFAPRSSRHLTVKQIREEQKSIRGTIYHFQKDFWASEPTYTSHPIDTLNRITSCTNKHFHSLKASCRKSLSHLGAASTIATSRPLFCQ